MTHATPSPVFRDGLRIAKLRGIHSELTGYRDYAPVGPEAKRGSGEILPFVRGLYLSAQIIYFVRPIVAQFGFDVHWGHIIHKTQVYCSPECDIIIHRNGSVHNWNGNVLDFHFVDLDRVVAVISCKSIVASVDEDYCKKLRSFGVPSISLLGESCSASNYANLQQRAVDAGYAGFWCLAVDGEQGPKHDETMLLNFIRFLEALRPA